VVGVLIAGTPSDGWILQLGSVSGIRVHIAKIFLYRSKVLSAMTLLNSCLANHGHFSNELIHGIIGFIKK
jgi:hypothetical protein